MAKSADIGSKRLISLNPVAWVRWLTGDHQVDQADLLSGEFQWISRANDALLKVHSPVHGTFLSPTKSNYAPTSMPRNGCGLMLLWARKNFIYPLFLF
ncbi:MAG: hypothetical protein IPL78_28795 [Chloroflexi bacterium]|nr:hypothetical protein [Chloroflexota bacterium]